MGVAGVIFARSEIEMRTWNVTEITLVANYMNHEPDTLTTPCRSLSLSPPQFKEQSGADGFIQRSMVKPSVMTAIGVDASVIRTLMWKPNRLTFWDTITKKEETFPISSVDVSPLNEVHFIVA
jgi:hypothetical protein